LQDHNPLILEVVDWFARIWPLLVGGSSVIGGSMAWYLSWLRIRELKAKLRQQEEKERGKSESEIYLLKHTREYVEISRTLQKSLRNTRFTNIAIIIVIAIALPVLYFKALPAPSTSIGDIRIEILEPLPGAHISASEVVRGMSTVPSLNHYLVVIPLRTGDRFIVDGPFSIDPDGQWAARARFGEHSLGLGERFTVSVLATSQHLPEGPLAQLPPDAETSDLVQLTRVE